MAWLPQVRAQRLLRDVYAQATNPKSGKRYAFDILVVDEAHHVAPSSPSAIAGGRGYAVDTQRTIAVRQLADKCEHRLFLSATPHNGHPESFTALLEMIDSRRFSRGALLDPVALKDITIRRLKRDLAGRGFKNRVVEALPFTPRDDEQEMFSLLGDVVTRSAKLNGKNPGGDIVTMLLKKRFLSSPFAFGLTLSNYLSSRGGRGLSDDDYEDIFGEGQSDEEEGLWEQDEAERLRESKGSDPLSAAEPGQLGSLMEWGLSYESRPDSRLDALLSFLDEVCRPDGDGWSDERVVVFTEYAHTVDWLTRVLAQQGYGDVLAVIQGSTPPEDREYIRAQFTEDPAKEPVRVLLATDAAGEGIDLQTYCHRLVNFDIPFNPSRLEQRIGRIDRYGQTCDPQVFHFVPDSDSSVYAADASFIARIAKKVANVEADLGSVNQVIGEEIQEHFARRAPARRKAKAVDPNEVINTALAGGMELNARLTQLEQGFGESRAEMHLEPANLRRVVDTALRIDHQLPLIPIPYDPDDPQGRNASELAVRLIPNRKEASPAVAVSWFEFPQVSRPWQATLKGLYTRLQPNVARLITFDPDMAQGRNDLVYVHLGHPIVQKAQRLLRSALWSAPSPLSRVTAVVVDDLSESFVAAVTRMVLVGRGGIRLHEDVFLAGVRLHGRRAMAEEKAEAALDQALDGELTLADEAVRPQLCELWNVPDAPLRARLEESMQARASRRHERVVEQLTRREADDIQRAHEIYAAFRTNLRDSLELLQRAEEEAAAKLFGDDQQRQRRRDIDAMKHRLEELDDEEAREVGAIAERYADVRPHTTAAAVVFALTRADADGWAG